MGLGDAIAENLGCIEKAVIEIIDQRGIRPNEAPPVVPQGGAPGGAPQAPAAPAAPAVPSPTLSSSYLAAAGGLDMVDRGAKVKRYTVQFNPSTLTLRGRGTGFIPTMSYTKKENEEAQAAKPAKQDVSITMSVRLIFDQVDPFDAFMSDKLNLSPSQLIQNVGKTIQMGKGTRPITVQKNVEGFIAALRSPYTRIITFHWGEMNYFGTLNNVNAQYTMFNLQGQPIRAYVNLTLRYATTTPFPNDLGPWEKAYENAFNSDELDLVRGEQQYSNLINLGG